MSTTCPKTMVEGKQWHAPCKIICSNKMFFVSVKFHGDHKTVTKLFFPGYFSFLTFNLKV